MLRDLTRKGGRSSAIVDGAQHNWAKDLGVTLNVAPQP